MHIHQCMYVNMTFCLDRNVNKMVTFSLRFTCNNTHQSCQQKGLIAEQLLPSSIPVAKPFFFANITTFSLNFRTNWHPQTKKISSEVSGKARGYAPWQSLLSQSDCRIKKVWSHIYVNMAISIQPPLFSQGLYRELNK